MQKPDEERKREETEEEEEENLVDISYSQELGPGKDVVFILLFLTLPRHYIDLRTRRRQSFTCFQLLRPLSTQNKG